VHQRLEGVLLARYYGEATRYPLAARAGSEQGYNLTISGTILGAYRPKIAIAKPRQLGGTGRGLEALGLPKIYRNAPQGLIASHRLVADAVQRALVEAWALSWAVLMDDLPEAIGCHWLP
jgi:hypothetical protein